MRVSTYILSVDIGISIALTVLQPVQAGKVNLRTITEEDAASWKSISGAALTPDGRWLAYVAGPAYTVTQGGQVDIMLRSVHEATERRYPAGPSKLGAGNLKMAPSGRWIAFQVESQQRENLPNAILDLAIVEVSTGKRRDLRSVRNFTFVGGNQEQLLLESYPGPPEDKTFSLLVQTVDGKQTEHISAVNAYHINPLGTQMAWLSSQGLQHLSFLSGSTQILDASTAHYERMTWSPKGNALAVFRRRGADKVLLAFTQLHTGEPKTTVISASTLKGFPSGYEITIEASPSPFFQDPEPPQLQWREDEQGVFLGVQPVANPAATAVGTPKLVLWHWRDHRAPEEKKMWAGRVYSQWGYVSIQPLSFIRLTDSDSTYFIPSSRGRYALAYNVEGYGWSNRFLGNGASSGHQLRDYVLIDLHTGKRRSLPGGIRVHPNLGAEPRLSPSGRFFLYQNNEAHYIAYDTAGGTSRNLTAGLPTRFYDSENDVKNGRTLKRSDYPFFHLQGWTSGETHVLLADYRNIWALPLKTGRALNLTGNGKQRDICYSRIELTNFGSSWRGLPPASSPDLAQPLYFGFYDRNSGEEGLARWLPETQQLEELHREYANLNFYQAQQADVKIFSRNSAVEPLNYHLADDSWRPRQQLTDINPQQHQFRWTAGANYLSFKTVRGDRRHAVLRLPPDYIEGRSYPTIVVIYLTVTATLHAYRPPGAKADMESLFLENGYAVLMPDIHPRINEPGAAALESVMAAVDAAVDTGIVDAQRLGLMGHSYGAFETAYIVSQTNRFKAAMPYAGLMNLWSDYGGVSGAQYKADQYESNQPFMAGPWWENWEAYLQNSPLYHARRIQTPLLLVHGNDDSAVPFAQSLELFSTLKRLGNRPVVLLEYVGERHGLEWGDGRAQRDYQARMLEFFNHFLKGKPAPSWWSDGVSRYEGQAPIPGGYAKN